MKKCFMFIIAVLLVLVVAPSVVFADDFGDGWSTNVTNEIIKGTDGPDAIVGNVASTVYDVQISWGSRSFDWVYNTRNKQYEWNGEGTLSIEDHTVNGYVTPSLSWTSESKYAATYAQFSYQTGEYYTKNGCQLVETMEELNHFKEFYANYPNEGGFYIDSECSPENLLDPTLLDYNSVGYVYNDFGTGEDFPVYTNFSGEVPSDGRLCLIGDIYGGCAGEIGYNYYLKYNLLLDRSKSIATPVHNDIIGHYTVTFTTH